MTLPYLAIAWLSGIYLQSVLTLLGWVLWLATPLLGAIILLWWREWCVRLGASCALLALLGGLRYQAAMPTLVRARHAGSLQRPAERSTPATHRRRPRRSSASCKAQDLSAATCSFRQGEGQGEIPRQRCRVQPGQKPMMKRCYVRNAADGDVGRGRQ